MFPMKGLNSEQSTKPDTEARIINQSESAGSERDEAEEA
jgi:hypothetical protein